MSGCSGRVVLERYGIEHMSAIAAKAGQKAKARGSAYFSAIAKSRVKVCPEAFRAALTSAKAWHHLDGLDITNVLDSGHRDYTTFIGRLRDANPHKWTWTAIGQLMQRSRCTVRKAYVEARRTAAESR